APGAGPATPSRAPSPSAGPSWRPTARGCGAMTAPRPWPRRSTPTKTTSGAASNSLPEEIAVEFRQLFPRNRRSGVERLDLLGVLGEDAAALELHGRRELLGVGEPLVGEQGEALHLLDLGEAGVGLGHGSLDLGPDVGVAGQLGHGR